MGAWDYGNYKYDEKTKVGTDGRNDERLAAGIVAIKNELRFTGFDREAMVGDLPFYGSAVANSVKDFQEAKGLTVDGQVGARTAKELFRERIESVEDDYDLPRGTLGKKISLESAFDPVARGIADPDDTGIAQINLRIHATVTVEQAYDPAFAIGWAARYVRDNYESIEDQLNIMKAARAAYNIGRTYARMWLLAGFPESGGPLLGGQDSFTRASKYIELIDKQTW
jgi:peptidoglycan hydrolase-like protein with peptidoglycan-binding domain